MNKSKGKSHWNWKGGKKINSQGYLLIYSPEHPFCDHQKYVREHRLVVEKSVGRFLKRTEVVHHKNKNKIDNRLSNLELLPKKIHDQISVSQRKKKEKLNKICLFCSKPFQVFPSLNRIVCCSKSCSTKLKWLKGKTVFGR